MALMLGRLRVTLSWAEIFRRTVVDAVMKDNCLGMAAQLAYYFFFSLFPALLFFIAVASFFPVARFIDQIVATLGQFAPPEFINVVTDQVREISHDEKGGLLTLGILTALWSSSAAMTAIIDTLNRAYQVEEGRPWWRVRLLAIGLTVAAALFVLGSFALIILGPQLAEPVAESLGFGPTFEAAWRVLEWPVACILAATGIALVYYYAPDVRQTWTWLGPGTIFATLMWLGASLGFRYYVTNITEYTETYGALGAAMVLLLWFYLSGFVLLLGAEMNAKIEHASPEGKNPGEKVEGEREKLGGNVIRRWMAKRRKRHQLPPSADEIEKAAQ